MRTPVHILSKAGILASFSISKKITEEEVNSMMKAAKSKAKDDNEIVSIVKTKIMKEIIDATQKGTLPGIILEPIKKSPFPIQSIEVLNRMVLMLSQKLKSKKINKLSLCYFINYLVGALGLTEEDFETFHRKIRESQENEEDEEEED